MSNITKRIRSNLRDAEEKITKIFRGISARLSNIYVRYISYRRRLQNKVRILRANGLVLLFRAQQLAILYGRRIFDISVQWSATCVAILVVIFFLVLVKPEAELRVNEVHFTCALIIGSALALVLSLSIIPAQRAAEAFSPAILSLYAQDRSILIAFIILVVTTLLSVLLGTGFFPGLDIRYSIAAEFILLGFSFDALRWFYIRVLKLLVPHTAITLVITECTKQTNRVSRQVERLVRIHRLERGEHAPATSAILFSTSTIAQSLRNWISQLDEFAHKLIMRRDTQAANEIVTAMGTIGKQYADVRRNSIVVTVDWDYPLSEGISDVSNVLNPIYESIRVICEDAAKSSNELIVTHCIRTLEVMTINAMGIVHNRNGYSNAPLAHSPCFYAGLCTQTAIAAGMQDAILAAVSSFEAMLRSRRKEIDTSTVDSEALETLFKIARASYDFGNSTSTFPAFNSMLLASLYDIQIYGYRDLPMLKTVLQYAAALLPSEIAMDMNKKRIMQVFPPYNLGFEASIPFLLQVVAQQIQTDTERPWVDPFHNFLEASDDIRHHYQEISGLNFQDVLLKKWILDSLIAVIEIHLAILTNPPPGSERFIQDVEEKTRWLISVMAAFFPDQNFRSYRADEAANSLAVVGMKAISADHLAIAQDCGRAIASIAGNTASVAPEPYELADLYQQLEILARAADAFGRQALAAEFRSMLTRPLNISDADWPGYLEARRRRLNQLDRRLGEIRRGRLGLRGDSTEMLQTILHRPVSGR
jgi:hypothetical protein